MARGDTLERQLRLLLWLAHRTEFSIHDIASMFGCTVRTVYRDLEVLQRAGVPLYKQELGPGQNRWRFVEGYQHKITLTLTWPEMLATAVGSKLMAGIGGTFFHNAARSVLEKARAQSPAWLSKQAAAMMQHITGGPAALLCSGTDFVQPVVRAIECKHTLTLIYRKATDSIAETRSVDPYHLHVQAGAVYFIAFCHLRQDFRTFMLQRIESISHETQPFERQENFSPEPFFHGAFGAWSGEPVEIDLLFDESIAGAMSERQLHPQQITTMLPDGRLRLVLTTPVGPTLVAYLVGLAWRVEIVAPESLKKIVFQEIEQGFERIRSTL